MIIDKKWILSWSKTTTKNDPTSLVVNVSKMFFEVQEATMGCVSEHFSVLVYEMVWLHLLKLKKKV